MGGSYDVSHTLTVSVPGMVEVLWEGSYDISHTLSMYQVWWRCCGRGPKMSHILLLSLYQVWWRCCGGGGGPMISHIL